MTELRKAFEKAGIDTATVRLEAMADECLRTGTRDEAVLAFGLKLISEKDLLRTLCGIYLDGRPQPKFSAEDQKCFENHLANVQGAKTHDSGGGHSVFDSHAKPAPSAVTPIEPNSATRKAYANAAKVIAITVMHTHRLSNGVQIGEVYWGSLHRLRSASARDTALLRLLINLGKADPHKKVRDVVTVDQLELLIQKSAEIADAM